MFTLRQQKSGYSPVEPHGSRAVVVSRGRDGGTHAQGKSRNAIAEILGRSGCTVSRIAADLGLSFERTRTAAAAAAKEADGAAGRAQLQLDALAGVNKLMRQMFEPTVIYTFGGKENDYSERPVDEPPFRDKRDIATAISALAATALKLAEYDRRSVRKRQLGSHPGRFLRMAPAVTIAAE